MIRKLVFLCVLALVLGFGGTAGAAALADVPADHWAYKSAATLADAGLLPGYQSTAFQGERVLTRYEFAIIAAKAMINQDKATDEQVIEIAKLQAEFSPELEKMGIRAGVKEKAAKVKIGGEVRTRYEWGKDSPTSAQNGTRLRLEITSPLNADLTFHGKYEGETAFSPGGTSDGKGQLTQAYIIGKGLGFDLMILGRQFLLLGQGLLAEADGPADGIAVGSYIGGNKLLLVGGCLETAGYTYLVGNIGYTPGKDLSLSVSYAKDQENDYYNSLAAGFTYKGIPDLKLTFEYGKNRAAYVKTANGGHSADAWMAKVKYLEADASKPKSYGLWVGYRQADPLFDNFGFTTLNNDYARVANTGTGMNPYDTYSIGALKNVKGFQYGVEYTVLDNAIATIMYSDLKDKRTGDIDASQLICQLTYTF